MDEIQRRIEEAIPGSTVAVSDLTGTNDHFQVTVVSEKFRGLSLLEQHRLVYAPLERDIQGAIHALSIKTRVP